MTDSERRRIFGLSKQLGINDEELHILVEGVTGCDSLKQLSRKQTYDVIAELNSRASRSSTAKPKAKTRKNPVPGMITTAQQSYCWAVMYKINELDPRSSTVGERLCGAINKILGITAFEAEPFRSVTFEEGEKLIEGLKRYEASAYSKAIKGGRIK